MLGGIFQLYSNFIVYYVSNQRTPHSVASDLVMHCLPMSHKKDARLKWVKFSVYMGESSKFPKSWNLKNFQHAYKTVKFQVKMVLKLLLDNLKRNMKAYNYDLPNSVFWGWLSMESQPQNPEFRNNPGNSHPCVYIQVHCRLDIFYGSN